MHDARAYIALRGNGGARIGKSFMTHCGARGNLCA
jgi:hypothetical protein